MRRAARSLCLCAGLAALCAAPAPGAIQAPACEAARRDVLSACSKADVVIVGERHREAPAHALFLSLVEEFLARGERVAVGLEIGSDRQPQLDEAIRGGEGADRVAVPPINSPSYRELLRGLARLAAGAGARLAVHAIDAPAGSGSDRDEAMAAEVAATLRGGACDRVVVLVGNLHALKEVASPKGGDGARERLAGLLSSRGMRVASLVQQFPGPCPGGVRAAFHPKGDAEATAMVRSLWGAAKADPSLAEPPPEGAVDGVVSWTCGE